MPTGANAVQVVIGMEVLKTISRYAATATEHTISTRSGTLKRARPRWWNQLITMPMAEAASNGQPKCQVSSSAGIRMVPFWIIWLNDQVWYRAYNVGIMAAPPIQAVHLCRTGPSCADTKRAMLNSIT